jgi:adenylate cyclase, class 2
MENQEIESKFYLLDLNAFEQRLKANDAELVQPRVFEVNLRFDTPDGQLKRGQRVLRLRQDSAIHLTYKGPAQAGQVVAVREEIEFEASDFQKARQFLEALGYQVVVTYEKYRTTYDLAGAHITLDEMPYGTFSEIEAPDVETVQTLSHRLGLDWDARISASYMELFERLKKNRQKAFKNLSFEELKGGDYSFEDLGVKPADR